MSLPPLQLDTLTPPATPDAEAWRQSRKQYRQCWLDDLGAMALHPALLRRAMQQWCAQTDQLLQQLWQLAGLPDDAALAAVGGYGRSDLYPFSDVDVLVLLPAGSAPTQAAERFISLCWDYGLEIGSAVRTVDQCLEEAASDLTVRTTLLESRHVAGAAARVAELQEAYLQALDPLDFYKAKQRELRHRHQKYEDTPYSLEPNVKESPGGLRDLHTVAWQAAAAGLGRSWGELARQGLLTPFEWRQIRRHEEALCLIRCALQLEAQRREDRLVFDLQTRVAERLGHVATKARRASEALMHRYYWAAKAVTQLSRILQQNLEDRLLGHADVPAIPINERFVERGGLLDLVHDHVYVQDQRAILETFLLYQTVPTVQGLSTRVMRALYNARSQMDARFRRDPVNRARFLEILRAPSGQTHVLRLMNDTSVLGRYLWVFRRIVGRMQHDLFHAYTVDQHILMVLRNVRRFFVAEHAHEYAYCSELALAFERPEVLYIAALFHDVAKGRGGDHSALGAEEVRRFCREHRVPPQDAALVEFLVREHLTMSQVAQKQDLSDPDVIARFVAKVGDTRHLTALYLLTVADIRGTSPKVWNAWKGKLLEDLYRISLRALGGAPVASAAEVEARKSEALRLLNLQSALPGGHEHLWRTLEVSYFLRHDAADIAWHTRSLSRLVGCSEPVVRARTSSVGEGLQVLVYSADQPDLFARLCAYFDKAGFSILDARIHTTRSVEGKAFALDTFQVVAPDLELPYRDLIALVESQLLASLQRAEPLGEPRQARLSRRVRHFPVRPRVSLRPDERAQRWLLEVSAADRPGLLYRIARILARHGVDLQLAKVSTLGERVEDHFVVSGAALAYTATVSQIEQDILEALSL